MQVDSRLANKGSQVIQILSAKNALYSVCKRAGLPNYGHHSMRHFFCTNAIEIGIDTKTIAAWVGHQDELLIARTYGHLRNTHSIEMAKKMDF